METTNCHSHSKTKCIVLVVLALLAIFAIWTVGNSISNYRAVKPSVTVTGACERNITSDLIVWTGVYSVTRSTVAEGYEVLGSHTAIVRNYLKNKGIDNNIVVFSGVDMSKETESEYVDGHYVTRYLGYTLAQSFTITSKNVEEIEKLSREITELIGKGVNITPRSPKYYYTKLADLKMEMLQQASEDALKRAETIAHGSKASVDRLITSNMGVFQIVGLNSDEDYSWGGSFNTSSKEKTASVTVKATYRLN